MLEKTLNTREDYQIKLLTSQSEINSIRDFWEAMQLHPFADFEFFSMIVQVRTNVISPCVLVLHRNKAPVALLAGRIEAGTLPIQFGYAKLAQIPVRKLVFIAGGFMGEKTEANWRLFLSALKDLMFILQLDLTIFEQLKVDNAEHIAVENSFSRFQLVANQVSSKHWMLKLPLTWNDFLKNRNAKRRYWLKRLPRILDKDFNGQWKIRCYSSSDEAREFIYAADSVASITYQRSLKAGFRLDEEFLRRIDLEARHGRLKGYLLFIKNEPKAFWYCFTYKRTLYLAATGYDPAYRNYALGTILLMKVFEDHCGSNIEVVDFGEGDAVYKQQYGQNCFDERSILLFSKSARAMLLRGLVSIMLFGTKIAIKILDRFGIKQRLKTVWRRRLQKLGPNHTEAI